MTGASIPPGLYSYSKLKVLHYGPGSVSQLPATLSKLGGSRALILSGQSIARSPVFSAVSGALGIAHVGSFTDIGQHTPVAGIKKALGVLKETGADVIVAVGGGSPVDAAKAISYYRHEEGGEGWLRIVAIPTTLSAAEYTMNAGYTNEEGHKVAVSNPELCPDAIILDANLTVHTPERLWLSTGLRAIDHAVEVLYRQPPSPFPIVESALSSLPLLFDNLLKSKANPNDIEVRQRLQLASYLSLAPNPQPGALGLSHSLGHKLGATYQIPHGITSCLTLAKSAALKARTSDAYSQENMARAAKRLQGEAGIDWKVSVEGEPETSKGGVILGAYIGELVKKLGLATTLEEWKVPSSDLEGIAKMMESGGMAGVKNQPSVIQVHELLSSL